MTWNDHRIPDAGYEAMIQAVRSDKVPNLLVMQYDAKWTVRDLTLVPSFFFTETVIEKRKPLGPTARRAGWVGCNILLSAIPPEGKLRIINNEIVSDPDLIRRQYEKVRPFAELQVRQRGWTLNVLRFVHRLSRERFNLQDLYGFESELRRLYPNNKNVKAKIRQQLQLLRDAGLINFLGKGQYALRATR